MAAEPKIQIRLLSIADTSGVQQMTTATKAATAATTSATTATRAAAKASKEAVVTIDAKTESLKKSRKSLDDVGSSSGQAAKGTANVGNAMLATSRGIDDAQYGLQGIINNFEQLAFSAGLSAGAVGGVTALAVAVNLLAKNWSKLTGSIKDVPSLGQLAPDEEATARAERFAKALQDQSTAYQQIAERAQTAGEAEKSAMESRMEMQELISKRLTKEETGPTLDLANQYDQRTQARLSGLQGEEGAQAAREAEFLKLDEQTKVQEKRMADMKQREELAKQMAVLQKQQSEDAAALGATTGQDFFSDMFGSGKMPSMAQLNGLMKDVLPSLTGGNTDQATANTARRYREQSARMQEIQKQMGGMEMPSFTQNLTGDAAKDQVIKQQAFAQEQARLQQLQAERARAGQNVEAGFQGLQGTRQTFRDEQLKDLEGYSQQVEKETGTPSLPAIDPQMLAADAAEAQRQGAAIAAQLQSVGSLRVQALTELSGGLQSFAAGVAAEIGSVKSTVSTLQQQVNNLRTTNQ
jgi:hypothetical protein